MHRYHPYQKAKPGKTEYQKPDWAKYTNYYALAGRKKQYYNPHAAKHGIEHPCRPLIIGPTGSGKTQFLLDLLRVMACFQVLYILTPFGLDDPLYALTKKMFRGKVTVTSNIEDLPSIQDLPTNDNIQRCFIFDDILSYPTSVFNKIMEYYTCVRKCNASCFMCTQSYFGLTGKHGKIIRLQSGPIFILPGVKEHNIQDLKLIASRYGKSKEIENLYDKCAAEGEVFWLDTTGDPSKLFRCGFDRVFARNE